MKRSNRLILLIGVLLAIVAFVAIVAFLGRSDPGTGTQAPTELPTVFATQDIPLGVEVTSEMVEVRNQAVTQRDTTAFADVSLVVGKIARTDIASGKQLTAADFGGAGAPGQITEIRVPAGQRAMAVQVDQVSGVGTVIQTGDFVDMVVGFSGEKFPVVTIDEEAQGGVTVVPGLSNTSVKLLLEGMQVLGTLLPPPPPQQEGQQQPTDPATGLTGRQQIVILSVTAAQAEVIKFAQLDGSISLALRSPADFERDDEGNIIFPEPNLDDEGITLFELVDQYGVLVPQLVEAVFTPGAQEETP